MITGKPQTQQMFLHVEDIDRLRRDYCPDIPCDTCMAIVTFCVMGNPLRIDCYESRLTVPGADKPCHIWIVADVVEFNVCGLERINK